MKRFVTTLFFAIMLMEPLVSNAQELKFKIVEDVEPNPLDMTAREENRNDGDGYAYAIIKVTSDVDDDDLSKFNFNFAFIKSEKEMHDGQLWIYVARGAKTMDIRREGYKPILKHTFKAIKEGTTYTMKLSMQTPKVKHRVLQFKVEPADVNAVVKVRPEDSDGNYELWGTVDEMGSISRLLETGTYLYEVAADNYESSQGRVALTANANGDNFVENIKLKPNFGYLEIVNTHDIAGADVYVNDRKVGTVPYHSERMECRDDYRLMISNGELYKTYSSTFAINRGETTSLSPKLESNFAETTIKVDNAEIFINGVSRGHGTWVGPLRAGSYDVECRLPNHEPSTRQITVKANISETFLMDKPTPIEGSLYVNTNPSGAKIIIDDKDIGFVTPRHINNILIGSHTVNLMHADYRSERRDVEIRKDETTLLDVELSKNEDVVDEPIEEVSQKKEKTTDSKKHQNKNQFYMQAAYQVGGYCSFGGAVGFFVKNINIEVDYLNGLGSETLYWSFSSQDDDYNFREEKLSSYYFSGKIGYGFVAGKRFRITPQIGSGVLNVSGIESKSNAINGTLGVRFDWEFINHFSLVAVPEYSLSLTESDTYKMISDVSSKVKGWANGFNIRLGMSINF